MIKESKEANHLIEEFMLLANEYVAKHIGEQQQTFPFVYRVHDEPDEEKLPNFTNCFWIGYKLNLNSPNLIAKSIQQITQANR
ncbi:MAG: hypothetical protein CM15mP83_1660 [Flavobacteriaceae bacterium]|nr:MAG: hypothetical protein CM15mP83_1660 [Flavobacteriaceae bacterium]